MFGLCAVLRHDQYPGAQLDRPVVVTPQALSGHVVVAQKFRAQDDGVAQRRRPVARFANFQADAFLVAVAVAVASMPSDFIERDALDRLLFIDNNMKTGRAVVRGVCTGC